MYQVPRYIIATHRLSRYNQWRPLPISDHRLPPASRADFRLGDRGSTASAGGSSLSSTSSCRFLIVLRAPSRCRPSSHSRRFFFLCCFLLRWAVGGDEISSSIRTSRRVSGIYREPLLTHRAQRAREWKFRVVQQLPRVSRPPPAAVPSPPLRVLITAPFCTRSWHTRACRDQNNVEKKMKRSTACFHEEYGSFHITID